MTMLVPFRQTLLTKAFCYIKVAMSTQSLWSEGYVSDTVYEAHYFADMEPDFLRMCLLLNGIDLPQRKIDEPMRCLELGYGQGINMAVCSAAVSCEFWGTDFNPDHTLRATELAQSAQLDAKYLNLSFAELDARGVAGALPQFDIIALHGVWSWISDENRRHILNIIHRNLKMGGVVYISYNTLPGWAPFIPVRDLLRKHADDMGAAGQNSLEQMSQAYNFVHSLAQSGAGYFVANPSAKQRLNGLEGMSLAYLAHEYLNRDWRPFYFADVAADMGHAKCTFVSSTRLLNQLDVCVPTETLPHLRSAATPEMRETLRDYCQNQQFRTDIFVKGSRRLTPQEHMTRMGNMAVVLACQLEAVSYSIKGPLGPIELKEEIYKPVLAVLADNGYAPKTINALKEHPLLKTMGSAVLTEVITVLFGAGYVHPARAAEAEQVAACARLNRHLCKKAIQGAGSTVLASPVIGGGVTLTRLEMLMLLSRASGADTPEQWAQDSLKMLYARGESLQRSDQPLSLDEAQKEMEGPVRLFAEQRMPWLIAMQCLPEAGPLTF